MRKLLMRLLDEYRQLSAPVKASLWFLVCNVLQAGMGVISTPIFTRLLSTDEYGVVNTFNSWRSILMIFTSLNLSYGVFNNAMVRYEDSKTRDEYVSSMQGLYCLITIGFLAFYLVARDWCNQVLGMSTGLVLCLALDLLCYPALLFWSGRQRYEFKYKWLVAVTLLTSVLNILAGVVAVQVSVHKDSARIISMVAVDVVFCGFFLIYQFLKGRKLCIPKFWKYALAFNIPLIPHYLSEMLLSQCDRIMISKYEGYTATANYSTAYSVAMLLQLVLQAISASFLPWAYSCLKHKRYRDMRKMGNIIMVLVSGVIMVLVLFAPELIYIFAGNKYAKAIYVIPPIALSVFFMFLYDMFATVEFYYEKNIFVMIASVCSAVLNLVLNYIFIPRFGYYAAGYTTLFCYFAYALGHYFFYRKVCRESLNGERVFDGRAMLIWGIIMTSLTLLINAVYGSMLIRYGIAVLIFLLFVWKRAYILEKIKIMRARE